ncbi:MAG: hypothetical protein AB7I19_14010 [Planctomycetota bacterium]
MASDERVWVVNRSDFFAGRWPQGLIALHRPELDELLARFESRGRFEARAPAEQQPEWKQIIPYCAIVRGDEVFCVERLATGGEARLHGRLSIGLGGHLGPEDGEPAGIIARGALRELGEELRIPGLDSLAPRPLALLNHDSDPVGSVHVGVVFALEVSSEIAVREISKLRGGFRPLVESLELWQDAQRLESWSRLLLPALPSMLASADGHDQSARTLAPGSEDSIHG